MFVLSKLQYLSKKLGADTAVFGQLQTVFAIVQLLGGPIYGRLGDVMGVKVALILAFASSGTSYLITGLVTDVWGLFLSRFPSIFMHVMQGRQQKNVMIH